MSKKINDATVEGEKITWFKLIRETLAGGRWIMQNLNYFLFLSFIAVVYIANGHMADKTLRGINKTEQEIKDLQYQFKTIKSEVMFKSEESQIGQVVKPLGLAVSNDVPIVLQPEKK